MESLALLHNYKSMTEKERYVDCWKGDKVYYPELHFGQIKMQGSE
jgi:hypothetical protein